ncbi:hypothetical protein [Solilutibacter silvestris]|uniref:hypothetical protein n=1 Tax=Solilutibacter silvestris TaxID=1645665 RepID=UPI003D352160
MNRPQHSPQRDQAWGRYYARRGASVLAKHYFAPMSNHMRIAMYHLKRASVIDSSRIATHF